MTDYPNMSTAIVRRARPDEAALLTALTIRAEGSWGYADDFMAWANNAFTVTAAYIIEQPVFVLEAAGEIANRKLQIQKWTWVGRGSHRSHKRQIEEELHRFERFQLH